MMNGEGVAQDSATAVAFFQKAAEGGNAQAQLKYAELLYRLRALPRADVETKKAIELARNTWELSVARAQLQTIRRLNRDSTRNVTWDKPLTVPALFLSAMLLCSFAVMMWI